MKKIFVYFIFSIFLLTSYMSQASKLVEIKVVDKDYLLVYFKDGDVTFNEDLKFLGANAYTMNNPGSAKNKAVWYGTKLSTTEAVLAPNWTIVSTDDADYGTAGLNPSACYRKSKINGMAELDWGASNDFNYEVTMEHSIYLKLPFPLKQGKTYSIQVNAKTNSDVSTRDLTIDIFNNVSEAIHLNLVGYLDDASVKSADLYLWMGDGGARNYAAFQGKKVYIYDVITKLSQEVGTITFWKANGSDSGGFNLINSNVWKVDFTGFSTPGTYRLVVEEVGCSPDFTISRDVYYQPFQVSTRGYFYMRMGQDNLNMVPVPRRPLFIPGISPSTTKVYITTMSPTHADWKTFTGGDAWDNPNAWAKYNKAGNPLNSRATGGHADAADSDRHLGHISSIYDMLLPYILTGGSLSDDNLGIAESGNGIPDIIDEARNEVDFWLSLRDGKAYGHGLTNPNSSNALYQAGNTALAAWANAANSAMLANCFQLAGLDDLMNTYKDSAVVAYKYAGSLYDQQLDKTQDVGDAILRGRDLKMMAAAFLYNVTGDVVYEDAVNVLSVARSNTSGIMNGGLNQLWATAAYLMTKRTVHYPVLFSNMKASIINEAKTQEANNTLSRPSRRATDTSSAYWKTAQNVQRSMIAHAVTSIAADKSFFENALVLEADWGLGRNPLNMIQMTTATTTLASKRSVENIYASGRNDGTPGLHPGQTPYLNTDDWGTGMVMSRPSWMVAKCYPDYATKWPKGEGYFNSRYVYAHSEFTPQQTMRGKMALYGYLYGMNKEKTQTYSLKVNAAYGTILIDPLQPSYSYADSVTITLLPDAAYPFKNWSGDASGSTTSIKIGMYSNKNISAEFNFPVGIQQQEASTMSIFPNPASNLVNITYKGGAGEVNLMLLDMNGKLVLQKTISETISQINISGLQPGIYYARMVSQNWNVVSKLVIMRN
ncbi:MAG TPA: T9SS type A sorting domain-containing protein [Prolixibacteraceae bacterium]|jgi:hypothetical protein